MRRCSLALLGAAAGFLCGSSWAAEPVEPPVMYPPNTWEGRSDAIVRVLDKLDAHVETLTIPSGQSGRYKSLTIAVRSCLQHPPGLRPDSAAFLTVQDSHAPAKPFAAWMFSAEPFVSVYESPVFGLELVSCTGPDVAPLAPPLLPPPPSAGMPSASAPGVPDGGAAAVPDNGPNPVYPSGVPDPSGAPDAAPPPAGGTTPQD